MHITFIVTGGTIFQKKDPETGCMVIGASIDDLISPNWLADLGVISSHTVDLKVRSGAELTYDTIFAARDAVRAQLQTCRGRNFVLVTGTDTLEEFAFCLDLLLGSALAAASASLVVTGAMKPFDIEGYDGRCNLQQAVLVATSPHTPQFGVLVTLNDDIHLARYVRKADSQLMGAFQSHPGPVGQVREGRVRFYYGPPPDAAAWREDPRLAALDAAAVRPYGSRVGIWVTGVSSGRLPEALLSELAGLVVAAPGTGSLPAALADQLAAWTAHLPVVLASRCAVGSNFDDHYYRGSRAKYESRGFLLGDYAHLNTVQSRSLLVLRLAAGVYPQYTAAAAAAVAAAGVAAAGVAGSGGCELGGTAEEDPAAEEGGKRRGG